MRFYGLSLAFAIIPEEMPNIVTMVLNLSWILAVEEEDDCKTLKGSENLGGSHSTYK